MKKKYLILNVINEFFDFLYLNLLNDISIILKSLKNYIYYKNKNIYIKYFFFFFIYYLKILEVGYD